jgi:hypothetical protein
LKAAYPSARICVVQPLKRSGWLSDPTQSSIELAVYSAGVVSGAASNGCVLWTAGAQPSMQDTTNTVFFADGTHPTPFGAALLAADFWLGGTAAQLGMRPGGP